MSRASRSLGCLISGVTPLLVLCAAGGSWSEAKAQVAPAGATLPNGVASGDVTQTTAVLWARASALGTVRFTYAAAAAPGKPLGVVEVEAVGLFQPVKVQIGGLEAGTAYVYSAQDAAGASSSGRFTTPAAAGEQRGVRLAISGDWRGELSPYPSVRNVVERGPDLWISFGDTIYADVPSPDLPLPQALTLADFRVKHNEVYSTRLGLNTLRDVRGAVPILAVIDDHEVTNDFAGGAAPASDPRFAGDPAPFINESAFFLRGVQAFQEFNPINTETYGQTDDPRTAGKVKMYRSRRYGRDAAIFMLDARSFRDTELPAVDPDDPSTILSFLINSFNPARTMLGRVQLDEVKADLLAAQHAGVTWKFVLVPEPIQNLGVAAAGDRFEGYAAERSELLRHIAQNEILNVVFVTADIHGTLVNNLNYQDGPLGAQIPTGAFEISTGSVAYDAPFGPTVAELAEQINAPGSIPFQTYLSLSYEEREAYIEGLVNFQAGVLGYDTLGLDGSDIDAVLVSGGYTATSTYGWSEFGVDAATQQLTVTTFGVPAYTAADLEADPVGITGLQPRVVSEFVVRPIRCRVDFNRDGVVNSQDFFEYIAAFFSESLLADYHRDGVINSQDVFDFLAAFFTGC